MPYICDPTDDDREIDITMAAREAKVFRNEQAAADFRHLVSRKHYDIIQISIKELFIKKLTIT